MREEPIVLNLRGRRPPPGHVCPSDVNIRWFLDHQELREVMRMSEEVLSEMRLHLLRNPCLDCYQRYGSARSIDLAVTFDEIISGISRFPLS